MAFSAASSSISGGVSLEVVQRPQHAIEHVGIEERLGHRYRNVAELEDDPRMPRTVYVWLGD